MVEYQKQKKYKTVGRQHVNPRTESSNNNKLPANQTTTTTTAKNNSSSCNGVEIKLSIFPSNFVTRKFRVSQKQSPKKYIFYSPKKRHKSSMRAENKYIKFCIKQEAEKLN